METLRLILQNWIAAEPAASLWTGIVAALLFGATFLRIRDTDGAPWERGLPAALARAVIFCLIAGLSYFLLQGGFQAFNAVYGPFVVGGSQSNLAWKDWRKAYGGTYLQDDLQLAQFVTQVIPEAVPPARPQDPPLYRNVTIEQPVELNSLSGFRGRVEINALGGHDNKDTFNVYTFSALYEYDLINPSAEEVRTEFRFPTSPETRLYQAVSVRADGQDVPWRMADGAISWEMKLAPGQKSALAIHFTGSGENNFEFEVPTPREITNFNLTLVLNTDNC